MDRLHIGNQPFPKGRRFGVGIVDAKCGDALVDPEEDDAAHFLPETFPVGIGEVEWVDVFVALWRVLGVFDRAVGPDVEPVPMFLRPRMIG